MFNVANDFTESQNLAEQNPRKLERMKRLWDMEWRRYGPGPLKEPAPNVCGLNEEYSRATMTAPHR